MTKKSLSILGILTKFFTTGEWVRKYQAEVLRCVEALGWGERGALTRLLASQAQSVFCFGWALLLVLIQRSADFFLL